MQQILDLEKGLGLRLYKLIEIQVIIIKFKKMSDTVMIDTSTKKKYGISKWKGGQYGKSGYKSKGSKPYKKTSYDGIYYAKLQATFPVLVTDVIDTKNAVAGFCVAWG